MSTIRFVGLISTIDVTVAFLGSRNAQIRAIVRADMIVRLTLAVGCSESESEKDNLENMADSTYSKTRLHRSHLCSLQSRGMTISIDDK